MSNPPAAPSDNSTSGIATISQDQVSNNEVERSGILLINN